MFFFVAIFSSKYWWFHTKWLTGLLEFIKRYKQNPLENFFYFHYLAKLYIGFNAHLLGVNCFFFTLLIVNNFLLDSWMTIKFWWYIAEECIILWVWFGGITLFHFSVIMHSFQKLFQILAKSSIYVHFKTFIEFALSAWQQSPYIPNLGHLLWILQSMEGISIGNEKMSAFPHYRC